MFVGHFAVAFVAKRVEPKISLGTLQLASMVPDFLVFVFLIAGIEHVEFRAGMGAANYFDAYDIALSHSLLTTAMWGSLLALVYLAVRHYSRGAWVLLAVVLTHWILDVVAHRPDMALAPGTTRFYHFGLGLWTSVPATILFEGGFWVVALILYARSTSPRGRLGIYVFWAVIPLLTFVWYNNIAGPPPSDINIAPIASLVLFSLVVAWAYWINHLRPTREKAAPDAETASGATMA